MWCVFLLFLFVYCFPSGFPLLAGSAFILYPCLPVLYALHILLQFGLNVIRNKEKQQGVRRLTVVKVVEYILMDGRRIFLGEMLLNMHTKKFTAQSFWSLSPTYMYCHTWLMVNRMHLSSSFSILQPFTHTPYTGRRHCHTRCNLLIWSNKHFLFWGSKSSQNKEHGVFRTSDCWKLLFWVIAAYRENCRAFLSWRVLFSMFLELPSLF